MLFVGGPLGELKCSPRPSSRNKGDWNPKYATGDQYCIITLPVINAIPLSVIITLSVVTGVRCQCWQCTPPATLFMQDWGGGGGVVASNAVLRCGLTAAATAAAGGVRHHRDNTVIVMDYAGERNLFSTVNDRCCTAAVRSVNWLLAASL